MLSSLLRSFFLLALATAALVAAPAATETRVVSDVPYLAAGRTEKLDLYLPATRAATVRSPAVVVIHGGGWMTGDKAASREREIGPTLAAAGYVAVSINYRLGAGSWPTNLYDCKNAVRFLRAHAAEYQIDPDRIAVMGGSAGGHLALMVALTTDEAGLEPTEPYPGVSSRVRCVIDMYGITNLLTRQEVDKTGQLTGKLHADEGTEKVLGASRTENPALWKTVSPVSHITKKSPPMLILHGRSDPTVNYQQSVELAEVLKAHGVEHELILLDGIGHTFDLETWNKNPLPRDLRPVALAFFERNLRVAPAGR